MIEQAEVITGNTADEVGRCGVCGTAEDLVDGHLIDTPTGEICIDCWIEVIDAA